MERFAFAKRRDTTRRISKCDKCAAYEGAYYQRNKEELKAKARVHGRNNYAKDRKRMKAYVRSIRQRAIAHFGGRCLRCGFADARALQLDHVNGGGSKEIGPGYWKVGYVTYHLRAIADTTGKYQLLCANCNWIKRYERGEHREKKEGV
jgi:hypothetical protein